MLPLRLREELLQSTFHFWRQLASVEIGQPMQHSFHMPGLAFSQLHDDPLVRQEGLRRMQRMWVQLEAAESRSRLDLRLKGWARDLEWLAPQWCRELCVVAAECHWEFLPDDMRDQILEAPPIAGTSKVVEDSFNECCAQTEGARNGRQSPGAVWHGVAVSSVAVDFDLDPVRPASAGAVDSPPALPASMFHAKLREDAVCLSGVTQSVFLSDMGGGGLWYRRATHSSGAPTMHCATPLPPPP